MKNTTAFQQIVASPVFLLLSLVAIIPYTAKGQTSTVSAENPKDIELVVRPAHSWLPPFGIDRVGSSTEAVIHIRSKISPNNTLQLATLLENHEIERSNISFPDSTPFTTRKLIHKTADQAILYLKSSQGETTVIAKQAIHQPSLEFEAVAQPDSIINPIDIGTILVPADWLLLAGRQKATLRVAALSRKKNIRGGSIKTWFASAPARKTSTPVLLETNKTVTKDIRLNNTSTAREKDTLHIVVEDRKGNRLWHKEINVMVTPEPGPTPKFAAVSTKLRYEAGVLNIVDGKRAHYDYYKAWKPELKDFVVFLPNGSRWVFWRGASYIPIWASRHNTGLSYEWAERISPNDGFLDCPEPLMDKELRYGSVKIIESTPARIHVRWDYQSCDFNYKVNGDYAHEDYYFYPDGLGTRALTLTSIPEAEYEVAEFILLASQSAIPLEVLPAQPMDVISLETGEKVAISLPEKDHAWRQQPDPLIYRMRLHKDEPMSAFSFNPNLFVKPNAFQPFLDSGLVVTPAYWGGHWPLSQGFNTGRSIDASLWEGPSHNSLVTWAANRPKPVRSEELQTKDALGQLKTMRRDTWVWLIGMTDAKDEALLRTAKSFAQPPSLQLEGASIDKEQYSAVRRAWCLLVEDSRVKINIRPAEWCVNPVFELRNAPKNLAEVRIGDKILPADQYAWDGQTLWIHSTFNQPQTLALQFSGQ